MVKQNSITRRMLVKSSVFGVLAAAAPNILYSKDILAFGPSRQDQDLPHDRYPAIRLEVASEVVGVSHFNLDRLKELVDPRPELAKAVWDWGYGDWESAIGAASHVGRKDIADYLIEKGAVPTIFTFAMLGSYDSVKTMIDSYPGIQRNLGPHGFSLMHHAMLGLTTEGINTSNAQRLVDYLEGLGDADGSRYLAVDEAEKEKYLGDYKYGNNEGAGFSVKLNSRKLLSLGKIGKFGGALCRIGENEFTYNGAPSVTVSFMFEGGKVVSMTVKEPGLTLTALKVS